MSTKNLQQSINSLEAKLYEPSLGQQEADKIVDELAELYAQLYLSKVEHSGTPALISKGSIPLLIAGGSLVCSIIVLLGLVYR